MPLQWINKIPLISFLFTLLFLHSGHTCCQPAYPDNDKMANWLAALENAGMHGSVIVEWQDKTLISQGYGYSDREKNIRNTTSTLFDIGSLTKQFTAAAILKLEMMGKLSIRDSISKYFSDVPIDKAAILLHDLLRHQAGLISNVGKDYEGISKDEFQKKVFSSKLLSPPGTEFHYSNIGYSLLAMIIEKVSGTSYESFLYTHLWQPAGMEHTGYSRPSFIDSAIANGYFQNDSLWGKPTEKNWDGDSPYWHLKGNGGILSTADDLLKWHRSLMTENLLSQVAKLKMYSPALRTDENISGFYGYGWDISITERNTRRVWHNGTNHIFYSDFLRFIDEGICFIYLSNKYHPEFNQVNTELSRMIFNPAYNPEIPAPDNSENRLFTDKIIQLIKSSGFNAALTAYLKRKSNEALLEFVMRNEGFSHIDHGKPEAAMMIFEMNVYAHPESAKALQGLGEGYMETGNKEQALKYLKESLKYHPENPFVRDLISRLESNH